MKDTVFHTKKTINVRGKLLDLSVPVVMGVINVTPDSFFKASRAGQVNDLIQTAGTMVASGASVLDIGGYSSRPGAEDIPAEEEISRVIPAIEAVLNAFPDTIISVDTFRSEVAEKALNSGAAIVNDISGGQYSANMYDTIAKYKAAYILMHMKGTPQTMASLNNYQDLFKELIDYFVLKIARLREKGVTDIIVDPGFGFAKNIAQNFEMLKDLEIFKILNLPLMVGLSRKSMIYKKLGLPVEEALNGTTVLNTIALLKGASFLRVHDVKEASEAVRLIKAMKYF